MTDLLSTPQEPPQIIDDKRPPANWVSDVGGISIENLSIRYAPNLPAVIKSLSVEFAPRSKIGLVGRTGSGKSTFATSLLRFVEPSEGKIIIDGIDVCSIGLHDLRKAVCLIPQEAVLFAGTVRSNLDPFNQHSEAECIYVLERVGLSSTSSTSATPSAGPSRPESPSPEVDSEDTTIVNKAVGNGRLSVNLATPVSAGGHNFSVRSFPSHFLGARTDCLDHDRLDNVNFSHSRAHSYVVVESLSWTSQQHLSISKPMKR